MPDSNLSPLVPLPLLITGIAGVAGYNALHYFQRLYPGQVIGCRRADNWPLSGDGIEPCDMHDPAHMRRLFEKYRFAAVLNCEGTCKLKSCELDPAMAKRINISGVESLLDAMNPDTRLIHLSIDLVFSGSGRGGYCEHDTPDPVTVYGKTMAEAESTILRRKSDACVLRISLPMGVSFNGHAGAIDWIQSRFKKNKPATLYFDEVRTPTYTDCMNGLFHRLLCSDLRGLYHAGGNRRLSLYQIAQIVNRVGGYDPTHLQGCPRADAGPMPPRAGNVTLDSRKLAAALDGDPFDPWPWFDHQIPTHDQWHRERPMGESSSPDHLADVLYSNPRRLVNSQATKR